MVSSSERRPVRSSVSRHRRSRSRSIATGSRRCRASLRATLPCSASTPRRPDSPRPPERWRSSSGSAGGRGRGSARCSCSSRTMPTSRRSSPSSRPGSRPTAGSSRTTAAGSTGRFSSPGTGWPAAPRRRTPGIWISCRSSGGSSVTGCPMRASGPRRPSSSGCTGSVTSRGGRSRPAISNSSDPPSRAPSSTSSATTTRTSVRSPVSSPISTRGTPTPRGGGALRPATWRVSPPRSPASGASPRRSHASIPPSVAPPPPARPVAARSVAVRSAASGLRSRMANPVPSACGCGDRAPGTTRPGGRPGGVPTSVVAPDGMRRPGGEPPRRSGSTPSGATSASPLRERASSGGWGARATRSPPGSSWRIAAGRSRSSP